MPEQDPLHEAILVEIQLLPLEEDDLETVTAIGMVGDALRDEVATLANYRLVDATSLEEAESHKTRGDIEFFHFVTTILQTVHGPQDITALLSASGLTALWLLLKQRRVKKVEVKIGDRTIVVENADQHAVETSLKQFEEIYKQAETTATLGTKTEMKAYVSSKGNPSKNTTTNQSKH
jgi:hypothetical protein